MPPEITVVGSLNVDLVVPVTRLPSRGETVLGADLRRGAGGKGANQAVAAARLGRRVAMIGAVGDDADGAWLAERLRYEGVAADLVVSPGATGHALVLVEIDGESTIVVSPGANGRLSVADVESRADLVTSAGCLLLQHEVDAEVVNAAVDLATGFVILNPAPGRPIAPRTLQRVDVIVPNRAELAVLTGSRSLATGEDVLGAARSLPVPTVIVTMGTEGALVVSGSGYEHIPAVPVEAVDATAAGDSFCAALADALLFGARPAAAARWAARVAAVTVTRAGAQDSLPTKAEVEAFDAG